MEDLGGVGICGQMEIAPVILGGYKNIVDAAHREEKQGRAAGGRADEPKICLLYTSNFLKQTETKK